MSFFNKFKFWLFNPVMQAHYYSGIMHLDYYNGERKMYKGECTVWYQGVNRCSTSKEYELAGYWNYCKDDKVWKRFI